MVGMHETRDPAPSLSHVHTCHLQWELEKRKGVKSYTLELNERIDIFINGKLWEKRTGPLTVTLNWD